MISLRCSGGEKAIQTCFAQGCLNYPFRCSSTKCLCATMHPQCHFVSTDVLLKKLQAKQSHPQKVCPDFELVHSILTQALQAIQTQIKRFESWARKIVISKSESDLLNILQKGPVESLKGDLINQVYSKDSQRVWSISKQDLNKAQQALNLCVNIIKTDFHKLYTKPPQAKDDTPKTASKQHLVTATNFRNTRSHSAAAVTKPQQRSHLSSSRTFLATPERIKTVSRVPLSLESAITGESQFVKLLFTPSKIESLRLLYRASQHKFSVKAFHQECDNIPNTLTILKTDSGRVIGGFTPIPWLSLENQRRQPDNQSRSFLFSISLKQKYPITQTDRAIYPSRVNGPNFGHGPDLVIKDKANTSKSSYTNFPSTYSCINKHKQDKHTWLKFVGDETGRFRILQWQVFKITFGEDLPGSSFK